MVVFLERYVLPLLVLLAGALLVTNPMNWTPSQRSVGGVVDIGVALVVGLLISSQTKKSAQAVAQPQKTQVQPAQKAQVQQNA
jgi:hypothetical protein